MERSARPRRDDAAHGACCASRHAYEARDHGLTGGRSLMGVHIFAPGCRGALGRGQRVIVRKDARAGEAKANRERLEIPMDQKMPGEQQIDPIDAVRCGVQNTGDEAR